MSPAYLTRLSCRLPAQRRLLTPAELTPLLADLPGWQLMPPPALAKTFHFADFAQVLAFIQAVGQLAENADHHPTLEAGYAYCRLSWRTHDPAGLTLSDVICAAHCEMLAGQAPS